MGNRSSTPAIDSSYGRVPPPPQQEDACLCLFGDLSKHFRRLTGGHSDPVGTPLPNTPQYQRRRREQVKQALIEQEAAAAAARKTGNSAHGGGIYRGLEKDPGGSSMFLQVSSRTVSGNSSTNGNNAVAEVYNGPDAEQRLLSKYDLMEILGVGSTSTVHRCRNRQTRKEHACKIIDCPLMEERFQGMMAQFQSEIDALRQLQHPSIIRLYDVYMSSEKIYIVMELMEGGELFDFVVERGTLTEEEASNIVRKVTSALVYMHEKNIVHRDLKPENLLLKKKPTSGVTNIDVKIIDFGLSKAMEEPVARTFLGTRGYLAPEMLQRRDYTRAVDSWALGVIIFVLLCGCLPFDDDSTTVPSDDLVKAKFVLRFPRWAKNLSASAKDLLAHLLDVNPRTRYTAEQAMEHPWVCGRTASRRSLLSSPGRIRKSPSSGGSASRIHQPNAHARRQNDLRSELSPPASDQRVRKQSF